MSDIINVLYVDDDPTLLEIGKLFLKATAGFTVETIISARDAIATLPYKTYDAIVSDYQMPGMDGIAFLKAVRGSGNTIPFILFTGRGREEVVIQALNEGADFYLQKGGDPKAQFAELAHKIRMVVMSRKATLALQESEERFRTLFEKSTEPQLLIDNDGKIIDENDAALTLWEVPEKSRVIGVNIPTLSPEFQPDGTSSLDRRNEIIKEVNERGFGRYEWLDQKHDAALTHILLDAMITRIFISGVPFYHIAVRDITEFKKAERTLKESDELFHKLVATVPDIVVRTDLNGIILYANQKVLELGGYDEERDIIGNPVFQFFAPEDLPRAIENTKLMFERQLGPVEYTIITRDGKRHIIEINGDVLRSPEGSPYGMVYVGRDITQRKQVEIALAKSENTFRSIVETTPDLIWEVDLHGNFVYISPQVKAILGYSPEELMGRSILTLVPDHAQTFASEEFRRFVTSEPGLYTIETPARHKDGRNLTIEIRSAPILNTSGSMTGLRGLAIDITERKQVEEALLNANRKLSLLSSITRHDIRNKVGIQLGYLELAQESATDNPEIAAFIRKIESAALDIGNQIEFTRIYQDLGTNEPQWQDLYQILAKSSSPLEILVSDSCAGIEIFADVMLEKMFSNIIDNAIRHGERVTMISMKAEELNDTLVIRLEDNGIGIPFDEKEKIFERGYGRNTGLGLFLAREILAITGITISETGQPGKGARFDMVVPAGIWRKNR